MFLFINPGSFSSGLNEATLVPPIGPLYIATLLNQNGYRAEVYDALLTRANPREVMKFIEQKKPKVIGLRVYYYNIDWTRQLIELLRNFHHKIIIGIGGHLASYDAKKAVAKLQADFAISGEGEFSMAALADNINKGRPYYEGVPGITARIDNERYYLGPQNKRINNIDQLPFPDYGLVGGLKLYSARTRFYPAAPIFTTRGCPFECSFCSKDVFGNMVAYRSAENVIQEIISLKKNYGIKEIDILDDNFTLNRRHAQDILDLIIKERVNLAFSLKNGVRVESLDEDILFQMKRAGFYKIAFGIESADENVLRLCNKQLDINKLRRIALSAKKLGFKVSGFFIIGLPGETRQSVVKTFRFAKELKLDTANVCMATPYPGTGLYDYVKKHGRFLFDPEDNYDIGPYGGKGFYRLPEISEREMLHRFRYAYFKFYSPLKILQDFIGLRSFAELKWFIYAAISVFRGQFRSRARSRASV